MNTSTSETTTTNWSLDREIVLVRLVDAPRAAVYAAWVEADRFCQWFGPDGYTCQVHEMDVRPGGRARFDMVSAEGTLFTNRFEYLEVTPDALLVMVHSEDIDEDPGRFVVTVTFDEQDDGKTVLTLRQLHPNAERRTAVIGFGAVRLGLQTLAKLEQHLVNA